MDFAVCCQPLIQGKRYAITPEQLMRSRFSAYCTKAVDYIHQTYHPSQRLQNTLAEIAEFAHAAHFLDLRVHNSSDITQINTQSDTHSPYLPAKTDAMGYVSFSARFILRDKLEQIVETSRFVQCDDRWFYLDGQLSPTAAVKIGRNDLCPCQSGKKFKNCQHEEINPS